MRLSRRSKNKLSRALLLAGSAAVLALLLHLGGALQRLEWISYDARMALSRQDATPHPDIAVVLIDEASLQAMNPLVGRWPWPRSVYADLLEFMEFGGARAVLFDILLSEYHREDGKDALHPHDRRLAEATAAFGRGYHAAQFIIDERDERNGSLLDRPLPDDFVRRHALAATGFRDAGNNSFTLPMPELYRSGRIGTVGLDKDADGRVRRARLFSVYQGSVFPSLSVAALTDPAGETPLPVALNGRRLQLGERSLLLDEAGRLPVNFYPQHSFRAYSISGIFASLQQIRNGDIERLVVDPLEFENKIVFIGASAVGLEDVKATPLSQNTPGVFVHAAAASNILKGDALRRPPAGTTLALILIAAAAAAALVVFPSRLWLQVLLPPVVILAYTAACHALFAAGYALDWVAPASAAGFAWLGGVAQLSFAQRREKQRVRTMLGQYVSPSILAEVVDRADDFIRAEVGVSEHMTIMFADVRGFTGLSEQLPPARVVELLNHYFSAMTEVIFERRGTLDKFIGDAIMAFWGAPLRTAEHADKALAAALDMMRALERVNADFEAGGLPAIRIGIGLHTGNVILGNIGSIRKLDYTVIGDNVNLASRIEGLTSLYRCPVLLTETTRQALTTDVPCAIVDTVRVKGKRTPIRIYRPLARPDDTADVLAHARRCAELAAEAFAAYQRRDWSGAIALYEQLPEEPAREIFLQRCRDFGRQEPPDDWDGVYKLDSK